MVLHLKASRWRDRFKTFKLPCVEAEVMPWRGTTALYVVLSYSQTDDKFPTEWSEHYQEKLRDDHGRHFFFSLNFFDVKLFAR